MFHYRKNASTAEKHNGKNRHGVRANPRVGLDLPILGIIDPGADPSLTRS